MYTYCVNFQHVFSHQIFRQSNIFCLTDTIDVTTHGNPFVPKGTVHKGHLPFWGGHPADIHTKYILLALFGLRDGTPPRVLDLGP